MGVSTLRNIQNTARQRPGQLSLVDPALSTDFLSQDLQRSLPSAAVVQFFDISVILLVYGSALARKFQEDVVVFVPKRKMERHDH